MDDIKARVQKLPDERLIEIVEKDFNDYTPEALECVKNELNDRGYDYRDNSERTLKCPECEGYMELGEVFLRAPLLSSLLLGFSQKHCFFRPNHNNKTKIKVIDNRERRLAYHCPTCGWITFRYNNEYFDL